MVQNHGFVDGNKRTALHLAELLIQRSGYSLNEDDEMIVDVLVDVARGEFDYEDLASWFQERLVRET